MKTIILAAIRCSLMFTAVAAFSLAHPAKANLITNGGFETGDFTGWTVVGHAFVVGTLPELSPHSGAFQAGFGCCPTSLTQSVTATPGASYVVDFWLAGFGDPTGSLGHFVVSWGGSDIFSDDFFRFSVIRSSRSPSLRRAPPLRCSSLLIVLRAAISSTTSALSPLGSAFPMAARQFLCSVSLCSGWLPCGAN